MVMVDFRLQLSSLDEELCIRTGNCKYTIYAKPLRQGKPHWFQWIVFPSIQNKGTQVQQGQLKKERKHCQGIKNLGII